MTHCLDGRDGYPGFERRLLNMKFVIENVVIQLSGGRRNV